MDFSNNAITTYDTTNENDSYRFSVSDSTTKLDQNLGT
jgi:hypothetical protein